ncbi:hypothetical protein IQ238_08120 [Pleurocapsales cyanobacterium LEGE 06147]|nr:hypothetical protein [Pleurocapsales cyanobacterium LEGE 06147]
MIRSHPHYPRQVEKLHRITIYSRWLLVGLSWLTFGAYGIWGLRQEIALWLDYFTWTAVRYGIAYNPLPSLCLAFCIGMSASVLVWQSRNIIWGLPARERYRLEQQVKRIMAKGPNHPLWKWIK